MVDRGGSRISEGGGGGANMDIYICGKKVDTTSVRSTLRMRSMLYLGGSGGMPPTGKFCKIGLLILNLVVLLSEK